MRNRLKTSLNRWRVALLILFSVVFGLAVMFAVPGFVSARAEAIDWTKPENIAANTEAYIAERHTDIYWEDHAQGTELTAEYLADNDNRLDGVVLYLTEDIALKVPIVVSNEVSIDLNGHSITLFNDSTADPDFDPSLMTSLIRIEAGATLNLFDCQSSGVISGNTVRGNGGAISNAGTLNYFGGIITSNTVSGHGGGIYNQANSTFTMYGGRIFANKAGQNGGGIASEPHVAFTMYGGTVSTNIASAQGKGGGVFFLGNDALRLAGNVQINGNSVGGEFVPITPGATVQISNGTRNNLSLDGNTIRVIGPMTQAKVGVTLLSNFVNAFTSDFANYNTVRPSVAFQSDQGLSISPQLGQQEAILRVMVQFMDNTAGAVLYTAYCEYGGTAVYNAGYPSSGDLEFEKWVTTQDGNNEANLENLTSNLTVYAKYTSNYLVSVWFEKLPAQRNYYAFDTLNWEGADIRATFKETGTKYDIRNECKVIYQHGNSFRVGDTSVTISYTFGSHTKIAVVDGIQVSKKDFDASSLTLHSASVLADGTAHTLSVMGDLPDGIAVKFSYEKDGAVVGNEGVTEAGTYTVTALLDGGENYNILNAEVLTATLTVQGLSDWTDTAIAEDPEGYISASREALFGTDFKNAIVLNNEILEHNAYHFADGTLAFYLTDDLTLNRTIVISNGISVSIDLNGHALTQKASGVVIAVTDGATLSLYDGVGSGKVTGGSNARAETYGGVGGIYCQGATLNLYGGSITGNQGVSVGGVSAVQNATLNFFGGSITGNSGKIGGLNYGINSKVNLAGLISVTENVSGTDKSNMLYLQGSSVNIIGNINADSRIGIALEQGMGLPGAITSGFGDHQVSLDNFMFDDERPKALLGGELTAGFIVSFYDADGELLTEIAARENALYPGGVPIKAFETVEEGKKIYTFDKWLTEQGGTEEAVLTNIRSNMSVYASYTVKVLTGISVDASGFEGLTVYTSMSEEEIKDILTVTANFLDSGAEIITDYTISDLYFGNCTVIVTYYELTDTFTIDALPVTQLTWGNEDIVAEAEDFGNKVFDIQKLTSEQINKIQIDESDIIAQGFDITLKRGEDVAQPDSSVTVRIRVDEAFRDRQNLRVFFVSDDGTLEDMNATVDGEYIQFETTHFSRYIIVAERVQTYDLVLIISVIVVGVAIALVIFFIMLVIGTRIIKRRKKVSSNN